MIIHLLICPVQAERSTADAAWYARCLTWLSGFGDGCVMQRADSGVLAYLRSLRFAYIAAEFSVLAKEYGKELSSTGISQRKICYTTFEKSVSIGQLKKGQNTFRILDAPNHEFSQLFIYSWSIMLLFILGRAGVAIAGRCPIIRTL